MPMPMHARSQCAGVAAARRESVRKIEQSPYHRRNLNRTALKTRIYADGFASFDPRLDSVKGVHRQAAHDIGRSAEEDMQLKLWTASRHHASLKSPSLDFQIFFAEISCLTRPPLA